MGRVAAPALLALLGVALAPAARAVVPFEVGGVKLTLDVTESLFADFHTALDDPQILDEADKSNVFDLRNRLNVRLRADQLTLGVRLDIAYFANPPANPGQASQYQNDVRPEELFLTGRFGDFTVTVGDDYLTFGRGLALSLRKLDELGFATALRGLHVQWRTPRLRARITAGLTNTLNVDGVEEKLIPDPNDVIFGAQIEAKPVDGLKLAGHVVDIERRHSGIRSALAGALGGDDDERPMNNTRYLRTLVGGGSVELPALGDVLSVYAEVDALRNDDTRETVSGQKDTTTTGLAVYGQVQAFIDQLTLLAEVKHYDNWDVSSTLHPDTAQQQGITQTFSYIVAPTLERIDQRVVNNTDVTGGRLRADYTVPGSTDILFLSGAYFADAPVKNDHTLHLYGGFEHTGTGTDRVLLQAGYRREQSAELTRLRMIHIDLDVFAVVAPGVDIQGHWSHEFRDKNVGAPALQETYLEGTSYVSLNLPPEWSFTAQLEYLTDASTDNPIFPGAFVQYRFTRDSFVRLFAGRSKGGLKCSGGVCRVFPSFEGVRLESTVRF
ncbi:MAG: hypothetical protein EP329_15820 [Deltaproteobacteria bacterium]|nr:MAG: hypothetical protein EP329_15820 [Deltaproteobacteria bacterium]